MWGILIFICVRDTLFKKKLVSLLVTDPCNIERCGVVHILNEGEESKRVVRRSDWFRKVMLVKYMPSEQRVVEVVCGKPW